MLPVPFINTMPELESFLDIRLLAGAGALAAILYVAIILRKYIRIVIDVMDNQAWVPENGNGDSVPWLGEDVHFRATDGHPISGVLMRGMKQKRGGDRGVVIFAHEFASDRSIAARYCRPLTQRGFDVLAFDFRGHGASANQIGYHPRQWPSDRETADVCGAVQFVKRFCSTQNRTPRIGLFGLSRGACSAILAASQCNDISAIISDGAYSTDTATEYFMKRFATIFAKMPFIAKCHPPIFWKLMRVLVFREYRRQSGCSFPSVRKAIGRMGRMPVLFIHGERDSYIPFRQCQDLYDLAFGPKAIWIVPNARHNQCVKVNPEEYFRRIHAFLDDHLSPETGQARSLPARRRRHEVLSAPANALVPSLTGAQHEPTVTAV